MLRQKKEKINCHLEESYVWSKVKWKLLAGTWHIYLCRRLLEHGEACAPQEMEAIKDPKHSGIYLGAFCTRNPSTGWTINARNYIKEALEQIDMRNSPWNPMAALKRMNHSC
jgi:hypothetical protein